MDEVLGVGVVGAGPVAQAVHLPTLARLGGCFRVAAVMDVDEDVAREVAARAGGARATTDLEELLRDPDVDVVVVGSPPPFHTAQVSAACSAGVRAVLCEKPLATTPEEARAIARAAAGTGTPLVVGAMHVHDPGWRAARAAWEATGDVAVAVRSSVSLPPNSRFEDRASQLLPRGPAPAPADPVDVAAALRELVTGLHVHDLPLVRSLVPPITGVWRASWSAPFGGALSLEAGEVQVELLAHVHEHPLDEWVLEVWGSEHHLRVRFPPSYVHAGSASAVLRGPGGDVVVEASAADGYEEEWRHVHDVVTRGAPLRQSLTTVVEDLGTALLVADGAVAAAARAPR